MSIARRDKRKKLSNSQFESQQKVVLRYKKMYEIYNKLSLSELDKLRHTKMSQTDFLALKNVIKEKESKPVVNP